MQYLILLLGDEGMNTKVRSNTMLEPHGWPCCVLPTAIIGCPCLDIEILSIISCACQYTQHVSVLDVLGSDQFSDAFIDQQQSIQVTTDDICQLPGDSDDSPIC